MTEKSTSVSDIYGLTLVPEPTEKRLTSRQLVVYKKHREEMLEWLRAEGKDPEYYEGYSEYTVKETAYRLDKVYRWVWEHLEDGFTVRITHEHADAYIEDLKKRDLTNAAKKKDWMCLKRLFKWKHHEHNGERWENDARFKVKYSRNQDPLTVEERSKIRHAALTYGEVPGMEEATPEEVNKWEEYLSQRLGKPKNEITKEDWDNANSWKIPSLVWVSLDAGLRPAEVDIASTRWVDLSEGVLKIPAEDSVKNTEYWTVVLRDDTTMLLEQWMEERATKEKYADTDRLWLTQHSNPYRSQALKYILTQLAKEAGIETENRRLSWYSIRHSVGTALTEQKDLAAAQQQLRHKRRETILKYVHPSNDHIRDGLNGI